MAAALYKPPTRVTSVAIPWETLVVRADPSWNRFKHWEVHYEFTRRLFYNDPYKSGPYSAKFDNPTLVDGPYNVNDPGAVNPHTIVPPFG